MEKIAAGDLDQDINAVRDSLRSIDEKVTTLNGRAPRQRISYNDEPEDAPLRNVERGSFGLTDEASPWKSRKEQPQQVGGRQRISMDGRGDRRSGGGRQSFDHLPKRQRPDYLDDEIDDEEYGKRQKRTVQSTVVMPTLDSKGREEKIVKLKESENKDTQQRNRRMLGNLLFGTLSSFKKTEKKTTQQQKQEEVEKKLEESKKQELDARREEKTELLSKRREQEKELQSLQRKKALIQYAENRIAQLKFMKGSIKTETSPHIFWQPKKHTVRSLELKQATERQLDDQIKEREDQLKSDLESRERQISEERNSSSKANQSGDEDEYDDDDDDEEKNENEDIEVVLKDDVKEEEDEEDKEEEIDVHVELD